jgi:hypothetical protein
MQLPLGLSLSLMATKWKSILDPIISNPATNASILKNVSLAAGTNTINHLLGATQQGFFLTDQQAAATIYRSAPFNDKTLTLTASAPVVVNIAVF